MAVLVSIATGNFTAAGTWGVVDATSYLNSETDSEILTTAYSGTISQAFTPGAITISHLAVKLSVRTGTTGTMSVHLAIAGVEVPGTEVVINTADLPVAATADLNGGWILLKLAAPVLLVAATAYTVEAKTSTGSMVSLFRDGTTDNLSRILVTTTTQAPAAADDLIVTGEYTGAGTSNAFTVTMNNTATTDFGAASTSLVTPALAICSKGTLTFGVAASTAYYLKLSGNLIVYSGGTLNQGTTGTPMPATSTAIIQFDCGANVDFGLTLRNLSTSIKQGASKTVKTMLNTDEAIAATVIGVADTTGWAVADELGFATTTRTYSECEKKTILTVDSGVQITLTAGLTYAHSGTAPIAGEVINLTRNVRVIGASASLQAFIDVKPTANIDWDYIEFYWFGSATALKRGIDVATTTGNFLLNGVSIHDFVVASSLGISQAGVSGQSLSTFIVSNLVTYNVHSHHVLSSQTTGVCKWEYITSILSADGNGSPNVYILDVGSYWDNIVAVGNARNNGSGGCGIWLQENNVIGTVSNLTAHGCAGNGILIVALMSSGTISNLTAYRNSYRGISFSSVAWGVPASSLAERIFDGLTLFGNAVAGFGSADHPQSASYPKYLTIKNLVANAGVTLTQPVGIQPGPGRGSWYFESCTFGVTTAHATADINLTAAGDYAIIMANCVLASATEIGTPTNLRAGYIASQKHDQTAGNHKTWLYGGVITTDATDYTGHTVPSVRLTPNSASIKLWSARLDMGWTASVADTGTLTVTVKVRKSVVGDGAAYNGAEPRLIVRKNIAAGISADTVLDTAAAAAGSWETLSGVTAAVTDDASLEFVVDCDGTTGWVNVDEFAASPVADSKGMKYWADGAPVVAGDNTSGGGGGGFPILGGSVVR